jgi:hypothetical protein
VGVGECARTGQYVCKADGTGTECNATPGTPTPEVCDGLDNNCNGIIDDGVLLVFYKDMDGDGYTDGITQVGCTAPSGYVLSATSGDCDDNDPNINPARAEICGDEKDNNCNGQPDEVDVCGSASTFAKTIGGSGDDFAHSITQSSDGGYVVAGETRSFGAGDWDIYVVKLDSSGNVIWTKTIGGSSSDFATSIIQSSDGGYIVAVNTWSFGAGNYDIYVVKLDSSGNVIWTKTIGGSNWDEAQSIIQSSDGGYVVAGKTWSFGAGSADFYVVKLDSAGNVLWTKTIGGIGDEAWGDSIIQSSDGGYVVVGHTQSFGAGGVDMYVVKMDANGNVCFSQNITNYSVSSNVGSFSSPSTVAISQSPTVSNISPTISYGGSVEDVCALAAAPHLCSGSQDCGFGSAIATNRENVKSYGCSAGGVLSRFLIPASMLIVYGWLRKKRKKKKGGI